MTPTPIGVVILALCCFWAGNPARLVQLVLVAGVFEAAAAIIVGSLGVQPSLLPTMMLVALLGTQYLAGRRSPVETPTLHIMAPLLIMFAYAAVTARLLPETFAGRIIVWPQKLDAYAPTLEPVPLSADPGNFNQVIYLGINVTLACATALALGRAGTAWRALVAAYLLGAWLVVGIAAWELGARTVGLPYPKELLQSNPGWSIVEQSLGSLPRLQASFAEPASLGFYLAGIAFACTAICLRGERILRADALLVLALVTIFLSTSTTGIATVLLGLPIMLLCAAWRGNRAGVRVLVRRLALPGVACLLGLVGLLALRPELLDHLSGVFTLTLDKADSESFAERSAMNAAAFEAFLASGGLGIGWGSTRASSTLPGLLAGAGIVGIVAVAVFAARLRRAARMTRARGAQHPAGLAITAFGAALAGQFLAAVLSAPMITTPIFFVQLGIVIAAAARVRLDTHAAAGLQQPWPRPAALGPEGRAISGR